MSTPESSPVTGTPPDDDAEDRGLDSVPADQDPDDGREAADPRPGAGR